MKTALLNLVGTNLTLPESWIQELNTTQYEAILQSSSLVILPWRNMPSRKSRFLHSPRESFRRDVEEIKVPSSIMEKAKKISDLIQKKGIWNASWLILFKNTSSFPTTPQAPLEPPSPPNPLIRGSIFSATSPSFYPALVLLDCRE